MANTNRDVLLQVDVKTSSVIVAEGNFNFYITDKNTSNFYVQLMINQSQNPIISNYVILENAEEYSVILKCRKPDGELLDLEAQIVSAEESLFQFNLTQEHKNVVGVYLCELWIRSEVEDVEEIITTAPFKFTVLQSIINTYDNVVEDPQSYPILQDILNKIEEASLMNNATEEYVDEAIETVGETIDTVVEDMTSKINSVDEELQKFSNEIIKYNYIKDGKFQHVHLNVNLNEHEHNNWSVWGGSLCTDKLYSDEGLVRIKVKEVGSGTGIYQRLYNLEKGQTMTLSFKYKYNFNITPMSGDILYLDEDGKTLHAEEFTLDCSTENVHWETFTFTTPSDINFAFVNVGIFSDLGKVSDVTDAIYEIGEVKLERGEYRTTWVENAEFVSEQLKYTHNNGDVFAYGQHRGAEYKYIRIARFKIKKPWCNSAISFDITRRAQLLPMNINICWENVEGTDPELASFRQRGESYVACHLHKSATSTWDLYILKTEGSEFYSLSNLTIPQYWLTDDMVDISWVSEQFLELPSGAIASTPYNGYILPRSGNWWNNGVVTINSGGVTEIGKFLDFHLTNEGTADYDARLRIGSANNIHCECNLLPSANNTRSIGVESFRWDYAYLAHTPNVSSDRVLKENIVYIQSEKAKSSPTNESISYNDMYNFVKDDLELATYNFKGQEEQQLNFIAQDLLYNIDGTDNKVGQMIVNPVAPPTEEEVAEAKANLEEGQEYTYPTLSYDMGMYTSVLAGALKTALNKIEELEKRIDELEG